MHLYEKTIYVQNSEESLIIDPVRTCSNIYFSSCNFFPVIPIDLKFNRKNGVIQFIPNMQSDLKIIIKYLENNRQIIENINIVILPNNNKPEFSCCDKIENNDYKEYCKFMHDEKQIYYELLETDNKNNTMEIDDANNDVKKSIEFLQQYTNSIKYMSLHYS